MSFYYPYYLLSRDTSNFNSELCFPHLHNASCWKPKQSESGSILNYIVLSVISLLTVFLNLLVIISISHFKQLHTSTNLLLLSLAVSDFFVGLLMCFHIMFADGCWFLGDIVCLIYQYLAYIITSSSVGTMVLISVDRYVAICDPLLYSTKITLRRVRICIVLSWLYSSAFQSINLSDNLKQPGMFNSCVGEYCVVVVNFAEGIVDLVVTFLGPILIIVILYSRVFVVAVSQARAMRTHVAAITLGRPEKVKAEKSEVKAARTLGIVVVVFLLCSSPYYCFAVAAETNLVGASSAGIEIWFLYCNSTLNPVIYVFFYPWFRKTIKHIEMMQ
uniref:G-protein coupled receptors family 1 profile domain-containing protein n=1 Tax=Cynoglossus semilaevis TaxID=244447 RepID=A0A3P8V4Y0_CYNSE